MPRNNAPAYTAADNLREIGEYCRTINCTVCGETVEIADACTGEVDESLFCSDRCANRYQVEYDDYINREMARAAREFRNRTPETARFNRAGRERQTKMENMIENEAAEVTTPEKFTVHDELSAGWVLRRLASIEAE